MRDVVILGVGMHEFGRFRNKTPSDLGRVAVTRALSDSSVEWREIQAVYAAGFQAPAMPSVGHLVLAGVGLSGVPVVNCENACGGGLTALSLAYQAVAGGFYDTVLCVGVEQQPKRGFLTFTRMPAWWIKTGVAISGIIYAWDAQRYMHEYEVTNELFAEISVKSHKHASLTPYAHYRHQPNLTVEEVLNSETIYDPLTLLMLSPINDGASAAVVCARDVAARKYPDKKAVTIASIALASAHYDRYTLLFPPGMVSRAAKEAYEKAGIGPEDVDVAEVQDACASGEAISAEALGLCKEGEYSRLMDEGATQIGGRIPINTDGGYLSRGCAIGAIGLAGVAEIVWQLKGEAGPRQVAGAKVGLVETEGDGPVCSVAILKK